MNATRALPCGCTVGVERRHCPDAIRLWGAVADANEKADRGHGWTAFERAFDAALRHVELQLREVSHAVDRNADLDRRLLPRVGTVQGGGAGGAEARGDARDGGPEGRRRPLGWLGRLHLSVALLLWGDSYVAAIHGESGRSRLRGALIRVVGTQVSNDELAVYKTSHADSGIVSSRQIVDTYLQQERAA